MAGSQPDTSTLGEGLYWYAEKLAWGYDGVEVDYVEAFRLYNQAAEMGVSDAYIRMGHLQEYGKGTERSVRNALESYRAAARAGNLIGLGYLARLLSLPGNLERADAMWRLFFTALDASPEPDFVSASPGEMLHIYIATQLNLGREPAHLTSLHRHRMEIATHHQDLLEHAPDGQLERLQSVSDWIEWNLGPWPA